MEILLDSCVLLAAIVKRPLLQNGMEWSGLQTQNSTASVPYAAVTVVTVTMSVTANEQKLALSCGCCLMPVMPESRPEFSTRDE